MNRMKPSIAAVFILGAVLSPAEVFAQEDARPAPVVTAQLKSGKGPVACDCTNCSAPHCQPPGPFKIQTMTSDMNNAENVPSAAPEKPEPRKTIRAK